MDAGARAWLLKTAKINYWRVADWIEFDDLVNDGFVCWARVVARYERATGRVRRRSHLMSLFKRTYSNHIHDLSKGKTRQPVEVKITDIAVRSNRGVGIPRHIREDQGEMLSWNYLDVPGDLFEYERLIIEAPPILKNLLTVLLQDGPSATLRAAYRVARTGERETTNERLCRLIGANPADYDYASALRSFLSA